MLLNGLILFLSTLLSALLWFPLKNGKPGLLKLMLSFSGGFLLSVSVVSLLPEVFEAHHAATPLALLAGFYLQFILDYFSHGVEHGHLHLDKHDHDHHNKLPVVVLFSLCIHAFLEGLPLGIPSVDRLSTSFIIWGIVIHNVPVVITLVGLLHRHDERQTGMWLVLVLFASMTPLGMFMAGQFSPDQHQHLESLAAPVMAFVLGIFLHLSTSIIFESSEQHKFQGMKLLSILAGSAVALLIHLLLPHS